MESWNLDAIRKRSKSGQSGPWVTDYNEMAKKTVFRRASKWITLSPEVADALDKEDAPAFTSASLVADISMPAAELTAPVQAAPVEVDEVPMGEPAPAPAAAPAVSTEKTPQENLAYVCESKNFSYDDFAKWAIESGNMPDADSFASFDEVNSAVAKRLLRSTAGMLKGIATVKGIAV